MQKKAEKKNVQSQCSWRFHLPRNLKLLKLVSNLTSDSQLVLRSSSVSVSDCSEIATSRLQSRHIVGGLDQSVEARPVRNPIPNLGPWTTCQQRPSGTRQTIHCTYTEFQSHNTSKHQLMSSACKIGNETTYLSCHLRKTGGLAAVLAVNMNVSEDRCKP